MDEHILLQGEEPGIPLGTRIGRHIPNRRRHQCPAEIMRAAIELTKQICPEARLCSMDSTYNCVGLVLASRRTNVDLGELSWILQDDGYKQITEDKVEVGDLVVYRYDDEHPVNHVGIIVEKVVDLKAAHMRFSVLSQWGSHGEYFHEATNVPTQWYGTHLDFFTHRVMELV